ncbi:MAG: polysaccharide deacetylase family protein [bacterium]
MNILMILSQLEVTGAEVYAVTLGDKLIEKGHNVFIISDTLTVDSNAKYYPMQLNKRDLVHRFRHIRYLVSFIKKKNIQIVHAHSRASSWPAHIATRICKIPLIYTAHGYQHVHLSKKLFHAFGDYILAVCENIREQLIRDLKINPDRIEVLPNGIDTQLFHAERNIPESDSKVVSIIGRLSGPKGEVAYNVLQHIFEKDSFKLNTKFKVVGGKNVSRRFLNFEDKAEFIGYTPNVKDCIQKSDVIIGSGRVAIESLLMGKPTIALGEKVYNGLVTDETLEFCIKNNFGDISEKEDLVLDNLNEDIEKAIKKKNNSENILREVRSRFDINIITGRLIDIYQTKYSQKIKYEIPILLYHRLIDKPADAGKHGTYISTQKIESHFRYLKQNGYTAITFNELETINRLDTKKKYIILTFDDGYEDNYYLLYPLLKKYELKAVIFSVTHESSNIWDIKDEGKTFPLLNREQMLEMSRYGIEFGAHTMTHVDLTKIDREKAILEIRNSKLSLENTLDKKILSFAYPYGSLNDEIKQMVRNEGFRFGIATVTGPLMLHKDLFEMRRIVIHPNTDLRRFIRKVRGNYTYKKNKIQARQEKLPDFKT